MRVSRPTMTAFGICVIGSETVHRALFVRTSDKASPFEENLLKSDRRSVVATTPPLPAVHVEESSPVSAEILLRESHRVLLHYMPGASLPDDLSGVRALLDA